MPGFGIWTVFETWFNGHISVDTKKVLRFNNQHGKPTPVLLVGQGDVSVYPLTKLLGEV